MRQVGGDGEGEQPLGRIGHARVTRSLAGIIITTLRVSSQRCVMFMGMVRVRVRVVIVLGGQTYYTHSALEHPPRDGRPG